MAGLLTPESASVYCGPGLEEICETFENLYGGMWYLEIDPIKHDRKMIAHIDKKREALGINKARERIMMDMATRRSLESA